MNLTQKIIKLSQPLSLRKSVVPKYITIDTSMLINLFCKDKGKLLQNVKDNQWNI